MKKWIWIIPVAIAVILAAAFSNENDQKPETELNELPITKIGPSVTKSDTSATKSDTSVTKPDTSIVTRIIDGDTIHVDGQSIRFALASAPELSEPIGIAARAFIERICPVGSKVIVDEDDGQLEGSYGRMIAKITCNGILLNQAIVEQEFGTISTEFCGVTEFKNEAWTGCSEKSTFTPSAPSTTQSSCDPSYPDFCIPSPPPDLDCKDIPQKRFTVIGSDPHRFDGDKDGIGCES